MQDKQDKTDLPQVARYKPYYAELTQGEGYFWCSCGLSKKQPYCDGSHKGTGFKPMHYVAQHNEEVLFCACKHTKDQPFCDGSHNNLLDVYEEDDPLSEANRAIPLIKDEKDGLVHLNGCCYVADAERVPLRQEGNLSWSCLISSATGAKYQSQYYFALEPGDSPIISFADSDVVMLVVSGEGNLNIAHRDFQIGPETGIYVKPGESFRLSNQHSSPMKLYVAVCPQAKPVFLQTMPDDFDHSLVPRTIGIDPDNREAMADRFFQLLVDKKMGSRLVTQFIGEIPKSKAAMHRHLYEESIIILKGQGFMWTEDMKAAVKPGDLIFLPSKQIHSLECTTPDGMMLAGVIYPGDNPTINY